MQYIKAIIKRLNNDQKNSKHRDHVITNSDGKRGPKGGNIREEGDGIEV